MTVRPAGLGPSCRQGTSEDPEHENGTVKAVLGRTLKGGGEERDLHVLARTGRLQG